MKLSIRDNLFKSAGKEERKRATGLNFDFAEKKLKETESEPSRDLVQKFIAEQAGELPFKSEIIERINSLNIESERARYNKEEAFFVIAGSVLTTNSLESAKSRLEDIEEYVVRLELSAGNILTNFFSGINLNKSEDIFKIIESYENFYSEVEREKRRIEEEGKKSSSSGYKSNEIVHDFGDGWKVVYVPATGEMEGFPGLPSTSHDRVLEGNKNGLCLGSNTKYYQDNSSGKIYSVRNTSNDPEVTIRISGNKLQEAKGKNNNPPTVDGAYHADKWFKLQEGTLDYRSSYDYTNFPPYTKESAEKLWNSGDRDSFYKKGWILSWYKAGISEIDEYTRELIEKRSPLIIYSGLGKKYKEMVEPVVEYFAKLFLDSNDNTIFGQKGVYTQNQLTHESWKTYKKNPMMIQSVQKLGNEDEHHFLKLGLFKINEYNEISKNVIQNTSFGYLDKFKVTEDDVWKTECSLALENELKEGVTFESFRSLYESIIKNTNSEYYLDLLFKYDDYIEEIDKSQFAESLLYNIFYYTFVNNFDSSRFFKIVKRTLDVISSQELCTVIISNNEDNLKPYYELIRENIKQKVLSLDLNNILSILKLECIDNEYFMPLQEAVVKKIQLMDNANLEESFSLKSDDDHPLVTMEAVSSFLINNIELIDNKIIEKIQSVTENSIIDIIKNSIKNVNFRIKENIKSKNILDIHRSNMHESTLDYLLRNIVGRYSQPVYDGISDKLIDFFIQCPVNEKIIIISNLSIDDTKNLVKLCLKLKHKSDDYNNTIQFFITYSKINAKIFDLETKYIVPLIGSKDFVINYLNYLFSSHSDEDHGYIASRVSELLTESNDEMKIFIASKAFTSSTDTYDYYLINAIIRMSHKYISKDLILNHIKLILSKKDDSNNLTSIYHLVDLLRGRADYYEIFNYLMENLISSLYLSLEDGSEKEINKILDNFDILNDLILIYEHTKDYRLEKIFEKISINPTLSDKLIYISENIKNIDPIIEHVSAAAENNSKNTIYWINEANSSEYDEVTKKSEINLLFSHFFERSPRYLQSKAINSSVKKSVADLFRLCSKDIFLKNIRTFNLFRINNLREKFPEAFKIFIDNIGSINLFNILFLYIGSNLFSDCSHGSMETAKEKYLGTALSFIKFLQSNGQPVPSMKEFEDNYNETISVYIRNNESYNLCANAFLKAMIDVIYSSGNDKLASSRLIRLSNSLEELGLKREASEVIKLG
jgi:hypothetical protein